MKVVVRGQDIRKPPLLETEHAKFIEFYAPNGELIALLANVLNEHCWGLVVKGDEDWQATLLRYGYLNYDGNVRKL